MYFSQWRSVKMVMALVRVLYFIYFFDKFYTYMNIVRGMKKKHMHAIDVKCIKFTLDFLFLTFSLLLALKCQIPSKRFWKITCLR